ncbi:MAG: GtrA family protein [Thermodesulfobacteriota bacterium]
MHYPERLKRFLLGGSSAFVVNAALMIFFVEALRFDSPLLKNIANVMAMEISIFYHFLISRMWTWQDAPKKHRERLAVQFMAFNFAALAGVLIRIASFALMENWRIHYMVNMTVGVGMAALFDFILYDRLIFRRIAQGKPKF